MNLSDKIASLKRIKFPYTFLFGYKKKDVEEHLQKVYLFLEETEAENSAIKVRLAENELEMKTIRELQSSLLSELELQRKKNEDMAEKATEEAKLRIAKGQIQANLLLKEAEQYRQNIIRDADKKYEQKRAKMRAEVKVIQRNYQIIDKQTSRLIKEMTSILNETMQSLNKLSSLKKLSLQNEFNELNDFLSESADASQNPKTDKNASSPHSKTTNGKHEKSFFDRVDVSSN